MTCLTKHQVQKKVLQNGKPLDLFSFSWDEKTNTFSSNEDNLVIDFSNIDNCKFITGHNCIFKTGKCCTFITKSRCTFNAKWYCKFTTGDNCNFNVADSCTFNTQYSCTFNTQSNCTFDVGKNSTIIRMDIFEVITNKCNIKINPSGLKGHLELIDDKYYLNGDKSLGEHLSVDGVLSKVVKIKGNVYHVLNYTERRIKKTQTYVVKDGDVWARGVTVKEARENLERKKELSITENINNMLPLTPIG